MNTIDNFYKSLDEATEHQTRCSKAWLIKNNVIFVECKANAEIQLEYIKTSEGLVFSIPE